MVRWVAGTAEVLVNEVKPGQVVKKGGLKKCKQLGCHGWVVGCFGCYRGTEHFKRSGQWLIETCEAFLHFEIGEQSDRMPSKT